MTTFTWTPDQGARRTVKAKTFKASFGDGYAQRTADGINSLVESWSLNFSVRTRAEVVAIAAFLAAAKGVYNFTWVTPTGATKKFTCETWDDVYGHDGDCSVSATFMQDFAP